MRKSSYKPERILLRFILGGAAALAILILVAFGGYKSYQKWQVHRFVQRAKTYLSWGDSRSAILAARQVLEFDAADADAMRVLAEVSEREGLSAAIQWRQQIVEKHPTSVSDAVALAKTALKFGSSGTAEATLNKIGGKAGLNAGYHEALGQLALTKKNSEEAEIHFEQATKLDPQNRVLQLELATVQLRSVDAARMKNGRRILEGLLNDKELRVTAAKTLLKHAIERKDPELVHFAAVLRTFPEATFQDRLISLQLFARLQLTQFASALTDAQDEAAQAPEKLASLLSWMNTNNLSLVALDWVKRLPSETLLKRPVFVAIADCYVAIKDWAGLEQWCKKPSWEELEFLRHAYLARAIRGTNDAINAELEWSKAIKGAGGADDLETLQKAAAKWDWKDESIELLWKLSNNGEKQKAALDTLYQYYGEQGDTGSLYRVSARLARIAPDDPQVQNNFVQLSLLLNVDTARARTLARDLYDGHRTDANIASTYAFSLYSQKRPDQAVRIMSSLTDEELKRPEVAAYYGIMLTAAGSRDKAQTFLDLGRTARLLPEEKKLLDEAVTH